MGLDFPQLPQTTAQRGACTGKINHQAANPFPFFKELVLKCSHLGADAKPHHPKPAAAGNYREKTCRGIEGSNAESEPMASRAPLVRALRPEKKSRSEVLINLL